jgi:hypothetical protein
MFQRIMTPENVILGLKVAVGAVTVLLVASLVALAMKRPRLHGRINFVFFVLTMTTVILFEIIVRSFDPSLTAGFSPEAREALRVHLWFSIPSAIVLPAMLYTGMTRKIRIHVPLAVVFLILWTGTFITGVFYLPHSF